MIHNIDKSREYQQARTDKKYGAMAHSDHLKAVKRFNGLHSDMEEMIVASLKQSDLIQQHPSLKTIVDIVGNDGKTDEIDYIVRLYNYLSNNEDLAEYIQEHINNNLQET